MKLSPTTFNVVHYNACCGSGWYSRNTDVISIPEWISRLDKQMIHGVDILIIYGLYDYYCYQILVDKMLKTPFSNTSILSTLEQEENNYAFKKSKEMNNSNVFMFSKHMIFNESIKFVKNEQYQYIQVIKNNKKFNVFCVHPVSNVINNYDVIKPTLNRMIETRSDEGDATLVLGIFTITNNQKNVNNLASIDVIGEKEFDYIPEKEKQIPSWLQIKKNKKYNNSFQLYHNKAIPKLSCMRYLMIQNRHYCKSKIVDIAISPVLVKLVY